MLIVTMEASSAKSPFRLLQIFRSEKQEISTACRKSRFRVAWNGLSPSLKLAKAMAWFVIGYFIIALIWGFVAARMLPSESYVASRIEVTPVIVLLMGLAITITGHTFSFTRLSLCIVQLSNCVRLTIL